MGQRGLAEGEGADEVDLDHAPEAIDGDVLEVVEQQDARDVAERVESAEALDAGRDVRAHVRLVRHVAGREGDAGPFGLAELRGLLERLRGDVAEMERSALACQTDGRRATDAARRPRHDRHLAFESPHLAPTPSGSPHATLAPSGEAVVGRRRPTRAGRRDKAANDTRPASRRGVPRAEGRKDRARRAKA